MMIISAEAIPSCSAYGRNEKREKKAEENDETRSDETRRGDTKQKVTKQEATKRDVHSGEVTLLNVSSALSFMTKMISIKSKGTVRSQSM